MLFQAVHLEKKNVRKCKRRTEKYNIFRQIKKKGSVGKMCSFVSWHPGRGKLGEMECHKAPAASQCGISWKVMDFSHTPLIPSANQPDAYLQGLCPLPGVKLPVRNCSANANSRISQHKNDILPPTMKIPVIWQMLFYLQEGTNKTAHTQTEPGCRWTATTTVCYTFSPRWHVVQFIAILAQPILVLTIIYTDIS